MSLSIGTTASKESVVDGESDGSSHIVCSPSCRLSPRPTRVVLPTGRKPSLVKTGGSASKDAETYGSWYHRCLRLGRDAVASPISVQAQRVVKTRL